MKSTYPISVLLIPSWILIYSANALPALNGPLRRQLPSNATGVKTITSPEGITIRYKEPGKHGICENTTGVNSYAGYIDLNKHSHTFFWFFEARKSPQTAPLTLWLSGGPGSDSLIGLFTENGPCNVTQELTTELNPYSWSEISNMLYISQPVGVGFSYFEELPGHLDSNDLFQNASSGVEYGRYPQIDPTTDTTDLAAVSAWNVLQGFIGALPHLDARVGQKKNFNLWTESYGGHYGPAFYKYFEEQNNMIANGSAKGVQLVFDTLGIGNGMIDMKIQTPFYPDFAVNNTYDIKTVDNSVVREMITNVYKPGGCIDSMDACASANLSTNEGKIVCSATGYACQDEVENIWEMNSNRGVYDIRHPSKDPTPPTYLIKYLNTPKIQNALGVNLNYTSSSNYDVFDAFDNSGDYGYPFFKSDIEYLLENQVRVALYNGDADFLANWYGGEAVSLALNYTHSISFRKAGYAPFVVDGSEYGEVRQHGNFSFLRVFESGHAVAYYQPKAALEMFRRVLESKDLATGQLDVTESYSSTGEAHAMHIESFVALPRSSSTV